MSSETNTKKAYVNEILTGYYLLDGSWEQFCDYETALTTLNKSKDEIPEQEFVDQDERAKVMATAIKTWIKNNKGNKRIENIWWTASPGKLSEAYGSKIDSKSNPSDLLLQFEDKKFFGISAKSTRTNQSIAFKNPGIGSIESVLDVDFSGIYRSRTERAVSIYNLPTFLKERKRFVRENPEIQKQTQRIGSTIINSLRDGILKRFDEMTNEEFQSYLMRHWLDATRIGPDYIKVTGHGQRGNYSVSLENPNDHENVLNIKNGNLVSLAAENNTIKIVLKEDMNKRVMGMRLKYESEKLCSSIKLSGFW